MSAENSEYANMYHAITKWRDWVRDFGAITLFCAVLLWCIFGPGGLVPFMKDSLVAQLEKNTDALVSLKSAVQDQRSSVDEQNALFRQLVDELRHDHPRRGD